jgi:tagatose 6-phosphate kinase
VSVLTVTLNPALDVTYPVPLLNAGATHRVERPSVRAGGKGVNVARILRALGDRVVATGLAGGYSGRLLTEELATCGIPARFAEISAETRRTVSVVDAGGEATVFAERGPEVHDHEWARFLELYRELAAAAEIIVLSGSLPGGLPVTAYAELIRATSVPVILDAGGPALAAGAAAGPAVAKPNKDELAAAGGDPRALGADAVVVSDGPAGMRVFTGDDVWQATPPETVVGNPTGAGDAAAAALARGRHLSWPDRLADAVALSAAAVRCPLAGDADLDLYLRLRRRVTSNRVSGKV